MTVVAVVVGSGRRPFVVSVQLKLGDLTELGDLIKTACTTQRATQVVLKVVWLPCSAPTKIRKLTKFNEYKFLDLFDSDVYQASKATARCTY
jgi:hypothetical protein